VTFPCPTGTGPDPFDRRFSESCGVKPDFTARYAYESTRLLVAAIRRAGLNRARIRDALRGLSPWKGVAAAIEWDNLGRNGLVHDGAAICRTLPD